MLLLTILALVFVASFGIEFLMILCSLLNLA